MQMKLTVLTPVHISSGAKVQPFEYLELNQALYRINIPGIIKASSDSSQALTRMEGWVNNFLQHLTFAQEDNKMQSKARKSFTLNDLILNITKDINQVCENHSFYKVLLNDSTFKKQETSEYIKTASYLPYIPGTTIKGAIRTALLNQATMRMSEAQRRKLISRYENRQFGSKGAAKDLENLVFSTNPNDAKFDLLKYLIVSDTYSKPIDLTYKQIGIWTYSKEEKLVYQQPIFAECLDKGIEFFFDIHWNVKGLKRIDPQREEWKKIDNHLDMLFDLSIKDIETRSVEQIENHLMEQTFKALKSYYSRVIQLENKWSESRMKQENPSHKTFLTKLKEIGKNSGLMRIGFGTGWHSTTVGPYLRENNDLLSIIKNAYDSNAIKTTGKGKPLFEDFPSSRRLITQNDDPISLMGWIKIEENEDGINKDKDIWEEMDLLIKKYTSSDTLTVIDSKDIAHPIPGGNIIRGKKKEVDDSIPSWEQLGINKISEPETKLELPDDEKAKKKKQKKKREEVKFYLESRGDIPQIFKDLVLRLTQSPYILEMYAPLPEQATEGIEWKETEDVTSFIVYLVSENKRVPLTIKTTAKTAEERNFVLKTVWEAMQSIWSK